jgi:cupin 2 domain-containing protein
MPVGRPQPRARFSAGWQKAACGQQAGGETFLDLLTTSTDVRVEQILSRDAASPPDFWYEQPWDEFVLVVSGSTVLAFDDGSERRLQAGDYANLPAFCRHRVAWTDPAEETLLLAVHMPPVDRQG